jgi:hypothetical protein
MEIECVLLLSDHYKWIAPFYESALSHPKWSAKSALSLASHKRKDAVKLYSAQEKLRSAVLSEVLNGTDHLRGVGVLVVVPKPVCSHHNYITFQRHLQGFDSFRF